MIKLRQLRVKIKSLAAEQTIIKHESHKALASAAWSRKTIPSKSGYSWAYESLNRHRINDVRPEIRSALIAYGLLRGKTLEQIELPRSPESLARRPYRQPDWKRINRLIAKYGDNKDSVKTLQRSA